MNSLNLQEHNGWVLPPIGPILKALRRKNWVKIEVAYSEDGDKLHGTVTYKNGTNGSTGQLCPTQTQRVLWFIHHYGLRRLRDKLAIYGTAVSY